MTAKSKSFAVVGCGSAKLNCSDQAVSDLVLKLRGGKWIRRKSASVYQTASLFDSQRTAITLEGIRTRTANERVAECAAAIKFDLALRPPNEWKGMARTKAQAEDMADGEIKYTAERTDKGELYVTVFGLPDW
jgi:hypothetical protein